ncbi:hypothetical protein AVEN_58150-1 [Araneus ventricosus]|uniref:Uncharacterized protein n=1 Tax=Araneus ventricosus TaxID=182803 RepID=A0A4Y2Q0R0_ARAVE|nr:hypothetical protein AVEN_58150-1 [Araneus ventricosus]
MKKRKCETLLRMQCTGFGGMLMTLYKKPLYNACHSCQHALYRTPGTWGGICTTHVESYEAQRCKMSLTVHLLHSHIDCFPENLKACSAEQGERFYQDVHDIERRYQG